MWLPIGVPKPSCAPSMIALRSIAAASARRTRTSSNGFFLLLIVMIVLPSVPPITHREARIALELLQALERAEARHAVDVAGEQRRDLRRRIADEAEGHLLHRDLGGVAVLVVLRPA